MIKAIVSDMDGTLFEGHGETVFDLSARNEAALERIKSSPIEFCVASGRMIGFGIRLLEKYGFEKVRAAGFNGAVCYDQGEFVATRPLDRELIQQLVAMMKTEFPDYQILQVQGLQSERIFTSLDHPVVEKYRRDIAKIKIGRVMDFTIDEFLQDDRGTMAGKLSITMGSHEACLKVMERIGELAGDRCFITMSGDRLIEIANNTANKGVFVAYLKEAYGFQGDEIAVIGDALNDAEMFSEAEHTFAMASGSDELKWRAKHTVKDVAECIDWCLDFNRQQAD